MRKAWGFRALSDIYIGGQARRFCRLRLAKSAAIRPRTLQVIEAEFANSGVKVLDTQIHERDAFRAIFSFGGSLSELDRGQVSNVPAAVANARTFAAEVIRVLKQPLDDFRAPARAEVA